MDEQDVRDKMKEIWDLLKGRIPKERLWRYAKQHSRRSFTNWILEEIFSRGRSGKS